LFITFPTTLHKKKKKKKKTAWKNPCQQKVLNGVKIEQMSIKNNQWRKLLSRYIFGQKHLILNQQHLLDEHSEVDGVSKRGQWDEVQPHVDGRFSLTQCLEPKAWGLPRDKAYHFIRTLPWGLAYHPAHGFSVDRVCQ
jgi:hypothetical protein